MKPHQQELLARIASRGGVPASEVDGRVLRPLRAAGLVEEAEGRVVATRAGLRHLRGGPASAGPPARKRLSGRQEDLLRTLLRRRGLPSEELDGRVVRALVARGLAEVSGGVLSPTEAGRVYFRERPGPVRRRRGAGAQSARAVALDRVVAELEAALPPGSEVLVGTLMAAGEDLVDGFRRHARTLDERG